MKHLILILTATLMISMSGFAQKNVLLKIHHKLGDQDFAMEAGAKNNLDEDFNVTRLQYYISEIAIFDENGAEMTVSDLWVLADAEEETSAKLGGFDIERVEKISFHIGVDSAHNHLDPTTYPALHPLAPQYPSMHWGWVSGYRFVAFEGYGSSNYNQPIEFHGLGNKNYFKTEVEVSAEAIGNSITIHLDADYTRAVEDISVKAGAIVHGESGDAKKCLENFRDYVFSESTALTSTVNLEEANDFSIFPNPTYSGHFTIALNASESSLYELSITDVTGKQVAYFNALGSNTTIDTQLRETGLYFINLIKDGQPVSTKKLICK